VSELLSNLIMSLLNIVFEFRFISRSLFGGFRWSDWVLSTFAKLPCVVAFILVALAYATCGALALAAGLCFYFLLVFICNE
jgi:hypothetical protein